jgi:hypothetical protein
MRHEEALVQRDEELERLGARLKAVRAAIDSFDNAVISATPDQREVIDAVRHALRALAKR